MNLIDVGLIIAGLVLLIAGGEALVRGAGTLASRAGISPLVIGLVVVSAATSAPEFAVTMGAVLSGEPDLAVGNVVGSNIFNIGVVIGVPAMFFAEGIPVASAAITIDLPLMLAAAVALLPIAFTGFIMARWEGSLFVLLYVAYTLYLILDSTGHDAAVGFTSIMLWFVMPLVAMTLVAVTAYEFGVLKGKKADAR
jgi:cation:H+ antiporter